MAFDSAGDRQPYWAMLDPLNQAALISHDAVFIGSSVVPAFRGKGVYQALVRTRCDALRNLGIQLATIQAKVDTSAPICARIGFEPVCEIRIHVSAERQLTPL